MLDTHAFLWAIGEHGLSPTAQQAFLSLENELFLSAASYWEICLKIGIGKLNVMTEWQTRFEYEMIINQIQWLPIEQTHCQRITALLHHHRDPFDRMLIAQALVEGMTLMTADAKIQQYSVPTLW
ncbi:MAG: type II toxin-antitoxin system VapC family toxin [Caldilineaceae bacterium]|nr:type II toxin-antitoxin system VapC family toxin [Caldilineaceae bacterium]